MGGGPSGDSGDGYREGGLVGSLFDRFADGGPVGGINRDFLRDFAYLSPQVAQGRSLASPGGLARAARAQPVAAPGPGRSPLALAARGYANGGRAEPSISYEAQRFLDALRQADLEASGGGVFTPIPGGRVIGGGVNARGAVPVGRDGAALDFSTGQMGTSASGRGFRSNQSRMTGAGVGYTTPSGGRLSLDYHDRMMGDPDTLPGADPIELMDRPAPSRGFRLGYRRNF
jgi:hypothetical protein